MEEERKADSPTSPYAAPGHRRHRVRDRLEGTEAAMLGGATISHSGRQPVKERGTSEWGESCRG